MPYIKKERRARVSIDHGKTSEMVCFADIENAGELNYAISRMIYYYFVNRGGRYQTINDIVGALDGAKAEFQRRIVAPYEDSKIKENGDVY